VGASFDAIYAEKLDQLTRLGAVREEDGRVRIGPERARLDFLADLTRPYLEAYRVAGEAVLGAGLADAAVDRKSLVKQALERGRAEFLSGRVLMRESISKATLENAMEWMGSQGAFETSTDGKRSVSPAWREQASTHLVERIGRFLAT
jgi:glycerol-3-phosphate O-acyltransferase